MCLVSAYRLQALLQGLERGKRHDWWQDHASLRRCTYCLLCQQYVGAIIRDFPAVITANGREPSYSDLPRLAAF